MGHLGHSKRNSVLKMKSKLSLSPCLLLIHSLARMIQLNILILFLVEKPVVFVNQFEWKTVPYTSPLKFENSMHLYYRINLGL